MQVATGALRHGVLYDLLDREHAGADVRTATVRRLVVKFRIEVAQAQRVGRVARALLQQLGDGTPELARHAAELDWAAQLHEIGALVSHTDAHKHGAYILENADAPGFDQSELHRLGLLVLGHRGKLRKLEAAFDDGPFVHQLLCLRLAVILCHARRDPAWQGLRLRRSAQGATLALPAAWARAWPQSAFLLQEEVAAWQKTRWSLALAVC
jgi:exopolyphosphatase/guanosine-5'-triphosphate,3'-diphosphate pyrophosphatase